MAQLALFGFCINRIESLNQFYNIPGDYLNNPQDIYDWMKGARQNSSDDGRRFDLARPGSDADKAIRVVIEWLRQQGVK